MGKRFSFRTIVSALFVIASVVVLTVLFMLLSGVALFGVAYLVRCAGFEHASASLFSHALRWMEFPVEMARLSFQSSGDMYRAHPTQVHDLL